MIGRWGGGMAHLRVAYGAGVNMGLARAVEGAGMTHPPRHGVVHADATSSDENGGFYVFPPCEVHVCFLQITE